MRIEKALEGFPAAVEKCVVIEDSDLQLTLILVVAFAVKNHAWVDHSDDEAGDDEYLVRFTGSQELLEEDQISAKLRQRNG